MTKREREQIQSYIQMLMDEEGAGGGFTEGMGKLCEMVGWSYPAYEATKGMKAVDPRELFSKSDRPFGKPKE